MLSNAFKLGFGITGLALLILNYLSYARSRSVTCLDCGTVSGFPFPFYQTGGFVSFEEIVWIGLIGNVFFAIVAGLLCGYIFHRIWIAFK